MTNIAMLFVCLLAGMALRVTNRVPPNAHAGLNGFIIHIALPALILWQMHGVRLSPGLALPILMPWLLFAISAATFLLAARRFGVPARTAGALVLTAGLANTSFVGLPMIETFYGAQGLPTGIIIDQLGTYLVLSTLGITVACVCANEAASGRAILMRIATFPPLIALVLTFALSGLEYPAWVSGMLHRLGDTLAPLALVSVGMQLRLDQISGHRAALGSGLAFKLVLAPLALLLLYAGVLGQTGETTRITIFEAAMGPMIGGSIVAIQYGLNPALITQMVGIGIVLSFLTLPVWWWGLGFV
ncbi:MAG: AEC family transporter [Janthinobacterium lividum]